MDKKYIKVEANHPFEPKMNPIDPPDYSLQNFIFYLHLVYLDEQLAIE